LKKVLCIVSVEKGAVYMNSTRKKSDPGLSMRVTDPNMLRRVSSGSSSLPAKDRAKQALTGIRRYRRCDFEVGSYHFFFSRMRTGLHCRADSTSLSSCIYAGECANTYASRMGYHDRQLVSVADLCSAQVAGSVGKGAYGGVWRATIVSTKQDVVLKVVFPDPDLDPLDAVKSSPTPNQLQSFKREIEILSIIGEHPNIASLLGITMDFRVLVLKVLYV